MKAVVLAAGRGSRLGALTADRPKCLVELEGASLLSRQVAALRRAGADEVAVITGWRSEAFADVDLPTLRAPSWETGTMVDTLAAAHEWLTTGVVLVSYGDIAYTSATAVRLAAADAPVAVSYDPAWRELWESRFADPLEDAETFEVDDAGYLTGIGRRPEALDEVQGQYMGLLRFTPRGWRAAVEAMAPTPPPHLTGLLDRIVHRGLAKVLAVPADGPWFEFDHPTDVDVGREVLARIDLVEAGHRN